MLKMFRYVKEKWYYIVLIIALLFLQAYCDLSLPDYTSKIVNVGIQQKRCGGWSAGPDPPGVHG